jgi:2'-5' RNA ligase
MRLFYALWPESGSLRHWQTELAAPTRPVGGRPLPLQNLHMTLAFLGEVAGDRVNELLRLGDDLPHEAIQLRLDRIECWKDSGIACLRPQETPAALTRLVGQLHTGLGLAGFPLEARAFKPHITLARHVAQTAPALPVWPVIEWQVPALALVRSRMSPEGSEYAVLHTWALG